MSPIIKYVRRLNNRSIYKNYHFHVHYVAKLTQWLWGTRWCKLLLNWSMMAELWPLSKGVATGKKEEENFDSLSLKDDSIKV